MYGGHRYGGGGHRHGAGGGRRPQPMDSPLSSSDDENFGGGAMNRRGHRGLYGRGGRMMDGMRGGGQGGHGGHHGRDERMGGRYAQGGPGHDNRLRRPGAYPTSIADVSPENRPLFTEYWAAMLMRDMCIRDVASGRAPDPDLRASLEFLGRLREHPSPEVRNWNIPDVARDLRALDGGGNPGMRMQRGGGHNGMMQRGDPRHGHVMRGGTPGGGRRDAAYDMDSDSDPEARMAGLGEGERYPEW